MEDGFRIRACSDLDYEEMVVDIVHNNDFLAVLSQQYVNLKKNE